MTDLPDTPIACSLTPAQYAARTTDLRALARRALVHRERTSSGERLTFADAGDVRRDLEAAIAAEAACCPFLDFDLRTAGGGRLVLEIRAADEARPVIAELFA